MMMITINDDDDDNVKILSLFLHKIVWNLLQLLLSSAVGGIRQ